MSEPLDEKQRAEREEPDPAKALDEKLLGQRLPAIDWIRDILLITLEDWLEDPERGRQWIWENRERLLAEAAILNKDRVNLLARSRKITFGDPEVSRILEETKERAANEKKKAQTRSLVVQVPEPIMEALTKYIKHHNLTLTAFVSEALEKTLKDKGAL